MTTRMEMEAHAYQRRIAEALERIATVMERPTTSAYAKVYNPDWLNMSFVEGCELHNHEVGAKHAVIVEEFDR